MSDEHNKQDPLIDALIDGHDIDWTQQNNNPLLNGLKALDTIQRISQNKKHNILFSWKHLSITEHLDSGNYGDVYLAHDPVLDRPVALKLLKSDATSLNPQAFIDEARRIARIRHRHVLAIHGAGVDQGRHGFWCDYIKGQALNEVKDLDFEALLSISQQACQAVQAVHLADIIHGDIKPSNMMLDGEGQLILMDFGAGLLNNNNTDINHLIGSPLMMAPEQFVNQSKTKATDLYALGCTLYHLSHGRYPNHSNDLDDLKKQQQFEIKFNRSDVPRAYGQWVEQLLSNTAENRPTAQNSLQTLKRIAEAPRKKRIKRLVLTTIMALVLGTVASLWGMFQAQKERLAASIAAEQAQATSDFLSDVLASSFVTGNGRDVRVADLLKQASENNKSQMQGRPHVQATVNEAIGMSYLNLRMADESRWHIQQALTHHQKAHPNTQNRKLSLQLALSKTWVLSDDRGASDALIDQVLKETQDKPESQDIHQLALIYRAENLISTNQLETAERILNQVLDMPSSHHSNNHHYLAQNDLTNIYNDKSEFNKALESNHKALVLLQENPTKKTINRVTNRIQKATILASSGQFAEAETIYQIGLDDLAVLLGKNNDHYIKTLISYGGTLEAQGKHKQALPVLENAHKSMQTLHGKTSINSLTAALNLANAYSSLNNKQAAEKLMRETLDLMLIHHPNLVTTQILIYNLTELLNQQEHFSESLEILTEHLPLIKNNLGDTHLVTLLSQDNLAVSWAGLEHCSKAADLHQQLIDTMTEKFSLNSPHTHTVIHNHIDTLNHCYNKPEAVKTAKHWYQKAVQLLGADHALTKDLHPKTQL